MRQDKDRTVHLLKVPSHMDDLETLCGVHIQEDPIRRDMIAGDPDLCTCDECCFQAVDVEGQAYQKTEIVDGVPVLAGFAIQDGAIHISVANVQKICVILTAFMVEAMEDLGATNYLEMKIGDPKTLKMFVVRVQACDGKTPNEMKVAAEKRYLDLIDAVKETIVNGESDKQIVEFLSGLVMSATDDEVKRIAEETGTDLEETKRRIRESILSSVRHMSPEQAEAELDRFVCSDKCLSKIGDLEGALEQSEPVAGCCIVCRRELSPTTLKNEEQGG